MGGAEYNGASCSLFFMKPGNRLRELRRAAKLTQAELAAITGVSQPAISQIENGTRSMDVAWMRTFARALGCAAADLLEREDNPDVLDEHERLLIERYRQADKAQRETLERVVAAVVPLGVDEGERERAA
jgi:transcriptional regulator with XRE-family HTH domain